MCIKVPLICEYRILQASLGLDSTLSSNALLSFPKPRYGLQIYAKSVMLQWGVLEKGRRQ